MSILMSIRPTTRTEDFYTYTQSSQIQGQTGCIGHLRADMDSTGEGFFSTWEDHRGYLKTEQFKGEFDQVINRLRFGPGDERGIRHEDDDTFLKNRSALAMYCWSRPSARMKTEEENYGFRVDTDSFSYMMRLNPNKGEYNLYCYCYRRDWLEQHLHNAERGIRFIDSCYNTLFKIPDGGRIRIVEADTTFVERYCRYIDDYHLEVGSSLLHICELAENLEKRGAHVEPVRDNLPELCYSLLPNNDVIIIRRNEESYYTTELSAASKEEARALVDEFNGKLGVSRAQEEAMLVGSMFGWACPGADPANYDSDGKPVRKEER